MANERKTVDLVTPDFEDLRDSLKKFLQEQDTFTDYDFDGSVLSTLVDLLAANSHANAFYLNQVGNEAFLQTAVKRDSVVERAKQLGYTPRSASSAVAHLWIEFFPTGPNINIISIPRGTKFTARDGDQTTFTFVVTEDHQISTPDDGRFILPELEVVEGRFLTHRFTVDSENEGVLEIPNPNVDIDQIRVRVDRANTVGGYETYFRANDINDLTKESNAFFVYEEESGLYSVRFGDDVVSRAVPNGSDVIVEYIVSSGAAANGVGVFSLDSSISGVESYDIKVLTSAAGGSEPESIESIRFSAPNHWRTQNRAVTIQDYEQILREDYTNLSDITVWGGEDNDPPRYGYVFVAIKPKTGLFLTDTEKSKVKNLLKRHNVVSIIPIVEDPDYTLVNVSSTVYYNPAVTSKTAAGIEESVKVALDAYDKDVIGRFDKALRFSVLSRAIDNADQAVTSNVTNISLEKRLFPELNIEINIDVDFGVALEPGTVESTEFTYFGNSNCFVASTGGSSESNSLSIFQKQGSTGSKIISRNAGTVDLENGQVQMNKIEIDALLEISKNYDKDEDEYFLGFTATPKNVDIVPKNQQILNIQSVDVEALQTDGS